MARASTVLMLLLAVVGFREVTSATRTFINDHNEYAIGHIDRKDRRFDALIPKDAKIEIVARGFKWTEGPVWDKRSNALLFTDIPNNRVVRWSAKDGVSDFLKPSGYTGKEDFKGHAPGANGLAFDRDGSLILCQHGDRRVARLMGDKTFETIVDKYTGKRFNSPNDLVFAKNGDMYFTDPPYGLPGQMKDPEKEIDFQGVYRLSAKGELTLLTKEMTRAQRDRARYRRQATLICSCLWAISAVAPWPSGSWFWRGRVVTLSA